MVSVLFSMVSHFLVLVLFLEVRHFLVLVLFLLASHLLVLMEFLVVISHFLQVCRIHTTEMIDGLTAWVAKCVGGRWGCGGGGGGGTAGQL